MSDPTKTTVAWLPIASFPHDGKVYPCFRQDWDRWMPLRWKHNPRWDGWYIGDPEEYDDYNYVEEPPTLWFPLPPAPETATDV